MLSNLAAALNQLLGAAFGPRNSRLAVTLRPQSIPRCLDCAPGIPRFAEQSESYHRKPAPARSMYCADTPATVNDKHTIKATVAQDGRRNWMDHCFETRPSTGALTNSACFSAPRCTLKCSTIAQEYPLFHSQIGVCKVTLGINYGYLKQRMSGETLALLCALTLNFLPCRAHKLRRVPARQSRHSESVWRKSVRRPHYSADSPAAWPGRLFPNAAWFPVLENCHQ